MNRPYEGPRRDDPAASGYLLRTSSPSFHGKSAVLTVL